MYELQKETEEIIRGWRLKAEDPYTSEEDLRRHLRHTATMVEKLTVIVRLQEDMLGHMRIGFWIMFTFAFVLSCMVIWQEWMS